MSTMHAVSAPRLTGQRVRLRAVPEAAAEARRLVRDVLASRGVPAGTDAAGAAAVIASELVTNAVQAGPGGAVTLCLAFRPAGCLRIEVHDAAPGEPAMAREAGLADGGRGLALVAGLASGWGWYRLPGGKSVFATIKTAGPA